MDANEIKGALDLMRSDCNDSALRSAIGYAAQQLPREEPPIFGTLEIKVYALAGALDELTKAEKWPRPIVELEPHRSRVRAAKLAVVEEVKRLLRAP
jgi:hypothetical protein